MDRGVVEGAAERRIPTFCSMPEIRCSRLPSPATAAVLCASTRNSWASRSFSRKQWAFLSLDSSRLLDVAADLPLEGGDDLASDNRSPLSEQTEENARVDTKKTENTASLAICSVLS